MAIVEDEVKVEEVQAPPPRIVEAKEEVDPDPLILWEPTPELGWFGLGSFLSPLLSFITLPLLRSSRETTRSAMDTNCC
jgi:hypothetical protein